MPNISTSPMFLVYIDEHGEHHSQPWDDLQESGTLIDEDSGEDLEIVGWSTEAI